MNLPKLILLDRDATITASSSNPESPLYYVLSSDHLIIKPGAREAIEIIRLHKIPTVLATKQRCIDKGLITRDDVDSINDQLQHRLDFYFDDIWVEEIAETKQGLYQHALKQVDNPGDIWLFDDNEDERYVAGELGIMTFDGRNLFGAVCGAFEIV